MFVWLPEVASPYGPKIDHLFYIILYLTGGSFILTEAGLFYFAFKYRHRGGRRSHYTHGNSTVEVVWTVVPAVVLVVLTFMSKSVWDEVRHTWPDHGVDLLITAKHFHWEVRYAGADGKMETAEDAVLEQEMH